MDRHAAWAVMAAMPPLAIVFYVATRMLTPMAGYVLGLAVYWFCVLIPLILWRGGFRRINYRLVLPERLQIVLNAVLILGVGGAAFVALQDRPLPFWILGIVLCASIINGTLEETFWRGTLLKDNASLGLLALQLGMFTSWHLALLFAHGIALTGGAAALLGGAAAGGALWTWSRAQTGSIGFGVRCHVILNLFAFTELAANNPV